MLPCPDPPHPRPTHRQACYRAEGLAMQEMEALVAKFSPRRQEPISASVSVRPKAFPSCPNMELLPPPASLLAFVCIIVPRTCQLRYPSPFPAQWDS